MYSQPYIQTLLINIIKSGYWSFSGYVNLLFIEIIEAIEISSSTEVAPIPTVNTIQPRAIMSGATTNVTFNESQLVANVPVDDVPILSEAMCSQPPSSDEGKVFIIT